jgi:hypothetical protein
LYVGMGARLHDKSRLSGPAGKPCLFLMYVELELMFCVYYEAGEP